MVYVVINVMCEHVGRDVFSLYYFGFKSNGRNFRATFLLYFFLQATMSFSFIILGSEIVSMSVENRNMQCN